MEIVQDHSAAKDHLELLPYEILVVTPEDHDYSQPVCESLYPARHPATAKSDLLTVLASIYQAGATRTFFRISSD